MARSDRHFLTLIAQPNYRRTWMIGGLSGIVRWLEFLALAIFTYQLTGSAKLVALLAIMRLAPYGLVGFFIGSLTDRIDRRFWLITALSVVMTTSALFALMTYYGHVSYPLVVIATLITGIFATTDMPIRRRLMVDSVGEGRVPAALGFDNLTNYGTRGLGPLIGGATYQWLGLTGVFTLGAALYVICLCLAMTLRQTHKQAVSEVTTAETPSTSPSINASEVTKTVLPPATVQLLRSPAFLIILGVTIIYNIACIPFVAMVPVIVQKEFGLSPSLTGALAACEGIGGIIGSLCVGILARERTLLAFYFFGPLLYLAVILGLSFHVSIAALIVALLLTSIGAACFSATQYALVYLHAPPQQRGRATGLLSLGIGFGTIGLYCAGEFFTHMQADIALTIMAVGGLVPLTLLGIAVALAPTAARRPGLG